MAKILIIYSTVDGQTRRICDVMAEQFLNHETQFCAIENVTIEQLHWADKVLVGASIRYGKYRPNLLSFINSHKTQLESKPNAFFCVNAVARKPGKNTPETNMYMKKFLQQSHWQPKTLAVFAGRIVYQQYGFWDKNIIRFIMWLTKGPTDIKQTYEFTDWEKVRQFARNFAEQ